MSVRELSQRFRACTLPDKMEAWTGEQISSCYPVPMKAADQLRGQIHCLWVAQHFLDSLIFHWYLHQLCRALFTCSWSSKCKCWVWQCSLLHAEKEKMVLRERMRLLQAWKIEETVLHMIKASYCLVLLYTMSLRSVSQRSHYSLWILIVFGDVDCLLHQARAWLSLKAIEKSFFKTLKFLFLQDGFNQSYVK